MAVSDENLPPANAKKTRHRSRVLPGLALVVLLSSIGVVLLVVEYRSSTVDAVSQERKAPIADFNETRTKAEQGDPNAQNLLGEVYLNGRGVRPDSKAAAEWITKSAMQNHAPAQLNLGMLYEAGQGVPVDYPRAAEWYRKAAEQGNATAQYSLAVMYAYARGVTHDDQQSLKWLTRAADQGDRLAQYALGHRYISGTGVPQDLPEAFKWLSLAASQNIPDAATTMDEIKPKMKRDQIAEGRKRAEQFAPRKGSAAQ